MRTKHFSPVPPPPPTCFPLTLLSPPQCHRHPKGFYYTPSSPLNSSTDRKLSLTLLSPLTPTPTKHFSQLFAFIRPHCHLHHSISHSSWFCPKTSPPTKQRISLLFLPFIYGSLHFAFTSSPTTSLLYLHTINYQHQLRLNYQSTELPNSHHTSHMLRVSRVSTQHPTPAHLHAHTHTLKAILQVC